MKEISLHIMDIVQNSITANAKLIEISLVIDRKKDVISITIKDNGKGMSKEMLANVTSPFVTTRTTRRVGLGISLFKAGAEGSGGSFTITSEEGAGTELTASYVLDNIDRPPIGDFAGTAKTPVSYTHLDVYKRQQQQRALLRVRPRSAALLPSFPFQLLRLRG